MYIIKHFVSDTDICISRSSSSEQSVNAVSWSGFAVCLECILNTGHLPGIHPGPEYVDSSGIKQLCGFTE